MSVISGFFVRVLLWLLPLLAVWYVSRDYAVKAPSWAAELVMTTLFPSWALGSELHGTVQELTTNLTVRSAGGQYGDLVPEVHVLTYAYGMPLLVALLLAVRSSGLWWKIPLGLLALLPFQAWGICFNWLLQIAVYAGAETRARTYFDAVDTNLIGAGYQLGFLVLPSLAPVLIWLAMDSRLVKNVLLEGAFSALDTPVDSADC